MSIIDFIESPVTLPQYSSSVAATTKECDLSICRSKNVSKLAERALEASSQDHKANEENIAMNQAVCQEIEIRKQLDEKLDNWVKEDVSGKENRGKVRDMIIADLTNPYYKDLSIVRTDISSLPDIFNEIQQLKKFDTVYISFNGSLVSIPESIAKLDSVKSLKITSNKSLVAIPESIGALSSLKELEISFNSSLAILPKSILLLSKDCEVSLIHNSLFPEEKAALLKALSLAGYNGPKFSFDGYRFAAKGSFPEELKRKMERGEDIAGATHQDLFRGGRV